MRYILDKVTSPSFLTFMLICVAPVYTGADGCGPEKSSRGANIIELPIPAAAGALVPFADVPTVKEPEDLSNETALPPLIMPCVP